MQQATGLTLTAAVRILESELPMENSQVANSLYRAEHQIIRGYGYSIKPLGNGRYVIVKASTSMLEDNSHEYLVSSKECNCPNYVKTFANLCKHRLAVMIVETMQSA